MLDKLRENRDRERLDNIELVLGTETDPKLTPNSLDLALLVDVYHELSHPAEMIEGIRAALKPARRLVLVVYRGDDLAVPIQPRVKEYYRVALAEIVPMGLRHLDALCFLPRQ